ncbi:MurT ligase domain-containing protein [Lactovum odontotermitis]
MKLKSSFAKAAGLASQFILQKFFHRGSTFPGSLALKIDSQILTALTKDYEIIVVTGTNGKTLTTALTVGILQEAGYEVLTNPTGANMITGITAAFLHGKKSAGGKRQFAVLEIDEASLPKITSYIQPSLFVFTNIFRDQMDRYGEIYTTYDLIVKGAGNAPAATVLLNGDSPIFNSRELKNPVKYYGFAHENHKPQRAHYNTEGVLCPRCHHILDFSMNTYADLGNYICLNCGFKRPELDYRLSELTNISNTSSSFVIDGNPYTINVGGLYNIYNALAAVSVAEFYGLPTDKIAAGFEKSKAVFGRQETLNISGKEVTIVLIKNPVGANQALDMMALAPYNFGLVALLNANYADGIDTSWIWDTNFEQLKALDIQEVYTGGVRHAEMARRLKIAGLPEAQESDNLTEVLEKIKSASSEHLYVLATYTAMLEFRETLAKAGYISGEMQ